MERTKRADRNGAWVSPATAVILALTLGGCSSPLNSALDAEAPPYDAGTLSGDGRILPASEVTGLSFAPVLGNKMNPPPPVYVDLTDGTKAQDVYRATLALPDFPPGVHHCPVDWGVLYQITFSFSDGSRLAATLDPAGCQQVQIPGSTSRWTLINTDYWSELAGNLGIAESDIYPYMPLGYQADDMPLQNPKACTTSADCDAGFLCGYSVDDGCSAAGICIVSACMGGNCSTAPADLCGCDGQPISPVWSQSSANSVIVFYASAPAEDARPCAPRIDAGRID